MLSVSVQSKGGASLSDLGKGSLKGGLEDTSIMSASVGSLAGPSLTSAGAGSATGAGAATATGTGTGVGSAVLDDSSVARSKGSHGSGGSKQSKASQGRSRRAKGGVRMQDVLGRDVSPDDPFARQAIYAEAATSHKVTRTSPRISSRTMTRLRMPDEPLRLPPLKKVPDGGKGEASSRQALTKSKRGRP